MRVLDLFSGIGGFSIGLERAGMRTIAFCEIEPYCRAVLAKHWPTIPCFTDIRAIDSYELGRLGAVDIICGGFPCQDISSAGKGAGIAGKRSGLWLEFARVIGLARPRFVIVENVSALLFRGLGKILSDLAALGYDAEWHCIPASYVGAPHRRDRVWIIATDGSRVSADTRRELFQGRRRESAAAATQWLVEPGMGRMAHGIPNRVYRLRALGNAVIPQIVEIIGKAIMQLEQREQHHGR